MVESSQEVFTLHSGRIKLRPIVVAMRRAE
jgi:hypothetical protein